MADGEINKILDKIKGQASYTNYDITSKLKTFVFLGISILKTKIAKYHKGKIKQSYMYAVQVFDSQDALENYRTNAPTQALKLVNKYCGEREPYVDNVTRKADMLTNNAIFKEYIPHTGYFTQIDMNSAEPYYVSKIVPDMKEDIVRLYKQRKTNKHAKRILVSINGNLRNTHASIYTKVNTMLYEECLRVCRNVADNSNATILPFAVRRDAVIFYSKTNFSIEDISKLADIEIGENLGQWKGTQEYGTATTQPNKLNYVTDMESIKTKHTGHHIAKNSDFDAIECIFTMWNKKTYKIRR